MNVNNFRCFRENVIFFRIEYGIEVLVKIALSVCSHFLPPLEPHPETHQH